ncbi:MAG: tRNA guanosine(34) transglycosylase Tgt [Phycisphaerae bacterium]
MNPITFEITHNDQTTHARVGKVMTPHGQFDTPAFMPVGTRAAVKGITPEHLAQTGSQIILANTYHLMLRPGTDVVAGCGGLHKFMNWSGPILTDSGGFQIFSLASLRKIDDEGVTFSSHVDGQLIRLDPAEVIRCQNKLGADIIMAFDECPPWPVDFKDAQITVDRTIRWAGVCKETHQDKDQALFGIVQGSLYPELRQVCLDRLVEMDFPGYAMGGLSVGEEPAKRKMIVDEFVPKLPFDKPRYLMGIGHPMDIIESVAAGIDMFDCVLPTRNGRNAYAFTSAGSIRLRNEKYKFDRSPIDEKCKCYCCNNFSKAYIRHLFMVGEMLGPILMSIHNISFFQNFMRDLRRAICENRVLSLLEQVRAVWEDRTVLENPENEKLSR